MRAAIEESEKAKANYHVGTIYSSDVFYNVDMTVAKKLLDMGALCVEMEAAALYLEAARAGKNALDYDNFGLYFYWRRNRCNGKTDVIYLNDGNCFKYCCSNGIREDGPGFSGPFFIFSDFERKDE